MAPLLLISYPSDDEAVIAYYSSVLNSIGACAIEVQVNVDGKGKGLIATKNIKEGETVFVEKPLVSLQHSDNEGSGVVCRRCLRFVGSIESQIGHKLHCLVDRLRGAQRGAPEGATEAEDSDEGEVDLDGALEAGERLAQIYSHVTPERIEQLYSSAEALPLSEEFALPRSVPCRRGCEATYCSTACEQAAWEHSHCLLCTAPGPQAAGPGPSPPSASALCPDAMRAPSTSDTSSACCLEGCCLEGSSTVPPATSGGPAATLGGPAATPGGPAATSGGPTATPGGPAAPSHVGAGEAPSSAAAVGPSTASSGPSSAAATAALTKVAGPASSCAGGAGPSTAAAAAVQELPEEGLYGIRVDRGALAAFVDHARSTNEIFLLAAQVTASTWLRAARLLAERERETPEPTPAAVDADDAGDDAVASAYRAVLLEAWRPYMYAWKRVWWEAVAVPDDVDDEEEFRGQLRELASDSLELLSAAISDPRFGPELLQLEVYGSIVGMFELNNLGLTVSSPVEDYFLAVDEMEDEGSDKQAVAKITQPLLDALDAEYATPCEATAFMALQSCINHSCDPNCTAACDTGDSTVTVMAQRGIAAGDEITLSYIDVSLPYKERQAQLRDYGFVCRCARCVSEAAAARAKRQGAAKGVKVGRRR